MGTPAGLGFAGIRRADVNGNLREVPLQDSLAGALPGATDVWSTTADMAQFLEFLLRGNDQVLPDEFRQKFYRPRFASRSNGVFAQGLFLQGPNLASHAGHMSGYLSQIYLDFEAGNAVVLLSNAMASPLLEVSAELARSMRNASTQDYGRGARNARTSGITGVYRKDRGGRTEIVAPLGEGLVRLFPVGTSLLPRDATVLEWTGAEIQVERDSGFLNAGEIFQIGRSTDGKPTIEGSFISRYERSLDAFPERVTVGASRDLSWVSGTSTAEPGPTPPARRRTARDLVRPKPADHPRERRPRP